MSVWIFINKKGNLYINCLLVESERIELSSKQAINKLSTCLVFDSIFDKKQGQKQPLFA